MALSINQSCFEWLMARLPACCKPQPIRKKKVTVLIEPTMTANARNLSRRHFKLNSGELFVARRFFINKANEDGK